MTDLNLMKLLNKRNLILTKLDQVTDKVLMLYTCIWKVLDLNFGWNTSYPGIFCFYSVYTPREYNWEATWEPRIRPWDPLRWPRGTLYP
jgi:hypothetical protein